MSEELKQKLAQIRGRLRELREARPSKVAELEAKKAAYAAIPEGTDDTTAFDEAKEAMRAVGEIDDQIADETIRENEVLRMLGDREAVQRHEEGTRKRDPAEEGRESGWHGARLFEDEELRARLEALAGSKQRFSIELGEVADRATFAADITGTTSMRRGDYRGILPQIYRPLRVLDLIPTGTMDKNTIPYTQEQGALTGAVETAEGAVKPEAAITLVDAEATAKTIAAWMKIRKQALEDFGALATIIDGRLRYIVQRRLEGQVLAGDGTGDNLLGILNTSGIGNVAFQANLPVTELILSGITNIYLADGEADGVVLNPIDWQKALTEKAHNAANTTGSYEYIGGGPFGNTPSVVWGVPCVPSPALAQGVSLAADFALGATLMIRTGVSVLMSDSDQDDFVRNRVTLLGEMRAALPVWRPPVFQKVLLA